MKKSAFKNANTNTNTNTNNNIDNRNNKKGKIVCKDRDCVFCFFVFLFFFICNAKHKINNICFVDLNNGVYLKCFNKSQKNKRCNVKEVV